MRKRVCHNDNRLTCDVLQAGNRVQSRVSEEFATVLLIPASSPWLIVVRFEGERQARTRLTKTFFRAYPSGKRAFKQFLMGARDVKI